MQKIHGSELKCVEKTFCGGGYTDATFVFFAKRLTGVEVKTAKRSELHKFAVISMRWGVDGLENCRGLWKNCE